jgi:hypothetical protein
MRKQTVLLLILALVMSTTAPFLSVRANPHLPVVPSAPVPEGVYLIMRMASPTWNIVYENGTVNVYLNVSTKAPDNVSTTVMLTTYQGDWMQESRWCTFPRRTSIMYRSDFIQYNFSITGIPFGEHRLNFTAHAQGNFALENTSARVFSLKKTISMKISVRANPIITFASLQNATFEASSVPLNFTVDHSVTEISYCLDGQEPIPISGNTTLSDLANGQHNVTVYATDEFGYTGVSDILFFNVNVTKVDASEIPMAPFNAVSAVVVVTAVAGMMVYFKKRKQ